MMLIAAIVLLATMAEAIKAEINTYEIQLMTMTVAIVCATILCLRFGVGSKPHDWVPPTTGKSAGNGRGKPIAGCWYYYTAGYDHSDVMGSSFADSEASQRCPDFLGGMLPKVTTNNSIDGVNHWNEFKRNNKGKGWTAEVMRREYYKYRGDKNFQKAKKGISPRQRRAKKSQSEDAAVTDETKEVVNDDDV